MLVMARRKHEGVVGGSGCEANVTWHALIGMYDGMDLDAAFLLTRLGMPAHTLEYGVGEQRPTPLKMALENNVMVVESMMRSRFIHSSQPFLRLSDESLPLFRSYRSRYTSSKNFSDRLAFASESVLRLGTFSMPM